MENSELELAIIKAIMNDSANIEINKAEDDNEEEQNTI